MFLGDKLLYTASRWISDTSHDKTSMQYCKQTSKLPISTKLVTSFEQQVSSATLSMHRDELPSFVRGDTSTLLFSRIHAPQGHTVSNDAKCKWLSTVTLLLSICCESNTKEPEILFLIFQFHLCRAENTGLLIGCGSTLFYMSPIICSLKSKDGKRTQLVPISLFLLHRPTNR